MTDIPTQEFCKSGHIRLPNGCTLYWQMTEQGREYFSDECGSSESIWHTALVDFSTLMAAVSHELSLQHAEAYYVEQTRFMAPPENSVMGQTPNDAASSALDRGQSHHDTDLPDR